MKRDFLKIRKRLIVGCLAAAIAVAQPVSSVFANPHYDRRDTVAEEEFIYSARTSGTESSRKKVNSKAWKKINGVCYNGSGKIIPGAITRGMDVSEWQGNIDWKQVKKSDIDFAFVRISYGLTHEDYTYDENMTNAELAGVPTGTYVYSTALSTTTALKEAQLAISKMQGYKVSYPVVYDLEYAKASKLSAKTVSEMALTFCNEVRRAGYYPMVYCNTNWYDNYIESVMKAPILTMIGIKDEEELEKYSKKMNNAIIKESVNNLKRLNSDAAFVYGLTPEEDEMLVRNTRDELVRREALAEGKAKGKNEGLAEGKAKGLAEGKAEGKAEIAINLLKKNYPIDEIVEITGLSKEEIELIDK